MSNLVTIDKMYIYTSFFNQTLVYYFILSNPNICKSLQANYT